MNFCKARTGEKRVLTTKIIDLLQGKILFGINGLDILCEQLRYLACPGGDEIDSNWDLKSLGQ